PAVGTCGWLSGSMSRRASASCAAVATPVAEPAPVPLGRLDAVLELPHAAIPRTADMNNTIKPSRAGGSVRQTPRLMRRDATQRRARSRRGNRPVLVRGVPGDEVGQMLQRVVEVVHPERRELEVLAHLGWDR